MNWIDFAILGLSTWRISSLLTTEDGPKNIFEKFRFWIGVRYNEDGHRVSSSMIGQLFLCIWCISFWIGLFLSIIYKIASTVWLIVCLPFALSAIAIWIEAAINGNRTD